MTKYYIIDLVDEHNKIIMQKVCTTRVNEEKIIKEFLHFEKYGYQVKTHSELR